MNGFYSLWTAPYFAGKKGENVREFALQDYDLLTLLLSAAVYERHNGPTAMYADDAAAEYLKSIDLSGYFKRGILRLPKIEDIDPKVFWAAGKLAALREEEQPSVMIDTDLIIWRNIEAELRNASVAVIHREELNPAIYPAPETFAMKPGYRRPAAWDFSVLPANTAMLFLRDTDFKNYYVDEAFKFMHGIEATNDNLCPMVYSEQRILPMCAAARGLTVTAFYDRMGKLREQNLFTHIWGHKNVLKYNMDERRAFCRRIMTRLKKEYPERYEIAARIDECREYIVA